MPFTDYFPPIPQTAFGVDGFDYDKFKLWLEMQQWNFKKAINIQGDIISSNWNGNEPLDLSTVDTVATAGFALDSSEGSAQFEGSFFLGGTLELQGGTFRTASAGKRVEITDNDRIRFYTGDAAEIQYGFVWADVPTASDPVLKITSPAITGPTSHVLTMANNELRVLGVGTTVVDIQQGSTGAQLSIGAVDLLDLVGGANLEGLSVPNIATIYNSSNPSNVGVSILNGSVTHPALRFMNDTDTGIRWGGADQGSLVGGANDIFIWNVEGRVRIRSNTSSAGIWYQTTADTDTVFAGLVTATSSTQWGVWLGDWRVYVQNNGVHIPSGHRVEMDGAGGTGQAYIDESWGVRFNALDARWSPNTPFSYIAGTSSGGTNFGNGRFLASQGTGGAPAFSFHGDSDTGMRNGAANYLEFYGGATLLSYIGNNDFGMNAAPTTTNNTLPAYRSGASFTQSFHRLTSSSRFKKFIRRSEFDDLVPIFDAIEVKSWKEKKTMLPHASEEWVHGVIAEEVNKYAPQLVVKEKDGTPSAVDPANAFIIPTIAKVKRLEKRIEELEARLAA